MIVKAGTGIGLYCDNSHHTFLGLGDGVSGGTSHDISISVRKELVAVDGFKY